MKYVGGVTLIGSARAFVTPLLTMRIENMNNYKKKLETGMFLK